MDALGPRRQPRRRVRGRARDRRAGRVGARERGRAARRAAGRDRLRLQHDRADDAPSRPPSGARWARRRGRLHAPRPRRQRPPVGDPAERAGATVRFAEPDPETLELPASAVEAVLSERTRWVAVTAASNAVGTIPDLAGIVAAAHGAGARVYVDAVHAAPHRRARRRRARLRRARVLGLQVVRSARRHPVGAAGAARRAAPRQARPLARRGVPDRWENGTLPFEALAGVAAAADYTRGMDWDAVRAHEDALLAAALDGLDAIPGVTVYGRAPRPHVDADVQRGGPQLRRGRGGPRRARGRGLARQLLRLGARAPARARPARRRPRRLRALQRRGRRRAAARRGARRFSARDGPGRARPGPRGRRRGDGG